ncbi:hypothetical protein EDB80DRAFT_67519 [Ilyonectria destructans]|nr:hypothetical protein EDB80DRAFT_67519 [Ilyonectria destructans]
MLFRLFLSGCAWISAGQAEQYIRFPVSPCLYPRGRTLNFDFYFIFGGKMELRSTHRDFKYSRFSSLSLSHSARADDRRSGDATSTTTTTSIAHG